MRKPVTEIAIGPGAGNRTKDHNGYYPNPGAQLREQRSGAGSGDGPAQAEKQTTIDMSLVEFFDENE